MKPVKDCATCQHLVAEKDNSVRAYAEESVLAAKKGRDAALDPKLQRLQLRSQQAIDALDGHILEVHR